MVLVRVGAPLWLGVIVVSWGIVATSFAGLRSVSDFYLLRFLLGVTECGTFPGMWCAAPSTALRFRLMIRSVHTLYMLVLQSAAHSLACDALPITSYALHGHAYTVCWASQKHLSRRMVRAALSW